MIKRVNELNLPAGASRYYAVELTHCLEAGALLASLHVTASLLEMIVRGIVVERLSHAGATTTSWENRVEEARHLGFKKLIDYLVNAELFDPDDGQTAKTFYDVVRIPIHHGLAGRYVTTHDGLKAMFRSFLVSSFPTGSNDLEDVIEALALPQIESTIGILERNSV